MNKKILLIDENILENENFINVLRSNYEVDAVGYIKAARIRLQSPNDYDLVVLDVMMPTLGLFDLEETEGGLKTGLVYYEKELKPLDVPVLFWSWNADFESEIEKKKNENIYSKNTDFLLKDNDINHLLDGVNSFFNKHNKNTNNVKN